MNVEGMTAAQLANMSMEQFNRLTMREAEQALTILNRAVTKSLRRAEKAGIGESPAIKALNESGGKIKTRGHDSLNAAKAEIKRASNFMNAKTRTVTGAKAHHKQVREWFELPKSATKEEINALDDAAQEIFKRLPADIAKSINISSTELIKDIFKRLQAGEDPKAIEDGIRNQYERIQAEEAAETARYERAFYNTSTLE